MNAIEVVIVVAARGRENARQTEAQRSLPSASADHRSAIELPRKLKSSLMNTCESDPRGKTRLIVCAICGKGPPQRGLSLVRRTLHFLNRMIYFLTMFISCREPFQVAAVLSRLRHPQESAYISDSLCHY